MLSTVWFANVRKKCGECKTFPCFHENFSMMPIRLFCCSPIVRLLLFLSTKYLLKISLITNLSMSDISSNSSSSKTIFRFALTFNAILAIFRSNISKFACN